MDTHEFWDLKKGCLYTNGMPSFFLSSNGESFDIKAWVAKHVYKVSKRRPWKCASLFCSASALRSILLILLCICMGGTPVIENPGSSMIWMHDRFQWLLGVLENVGMRDPHRKSDWTCSLLFVDPQLFQNRLYSVHSCHGFLYPATIPSWVVPAELLDVPLWA